uniref:Large ribosomal subunit protein mL54 n=1 Tax=Steinernema glaseri TaxID=37863 RepID=A0A1I8AFP8_9BILA
MRLVASLAGRILTRRPLQKSFVPARSYAVGGKIVAEKEDKSYVESDAEKLAKHVCVNYFIQGEEPGPAIQPDSEYPPWLFELNLQAPRPLEDLDPEKDGWTYWRALRKRQVEQARRIAKLRTRFLHLQDSPSLVRAGGVSRKPAFPEKA